MKPIFLILFICVLFLAFESALAQAAADYYLPLRVGNYLSFHTSGSPSAWAPRTTLESIEGTDSISGQLYFKEIGTEVADDGSFNNVFHVYWLRRDTAGNILVAAASDTSSNLGSATLIDPPGLFFPNGYLMAGYSMSFPLGSVRDSVISVSETVQVPAGTFTNCIEIKTVSLENGVVGDTLVEYHYCAREVGEVLTVRVKPDSEAHTDELVKYSVLASVNEKNATTDPKSFSLSQNYPNPFNPSTIIGYQLPTKALVTLKVYDVLGREVETLVNAGQTAGIHSVTFDASGLSSGVYFYRVQAGTFTETKKLMVLK